MSRPRSLLTFAGLLVAAIASIATSSPRRSTLSSFADDTITVTTDNPVTSIAFKVVAKSGDVSPELEFSVVNAASESRRLGDAGPQFLIADAAVISNATDSGANTGRDADADADADASWVDRVLEDSGASKTQGPAVLVQIRERKSPQTGFGNASPIVPIPAAGSGISLTCYDVSPDGSTATPTKNGCGSQTVGSSCGGADSCERIFEARFLLLDRTLASQTLKVRAKVEASFGEGPDKSNAVSIERTQ